jgi:hypothetical protein
MGVNPATDGPARFNGLARPEYSGADAVERSEHKVDREQRLPAGGSPCLNGNRVISQAVESLPDERRRDHHADEHQPDVAGSRAADHRLPYRHAVAWRFPRLIWVCSVKVVELGGGLSSGGHRPLRSRDGVHAATCFRRRLRRLATVSPMSRPEFRPVDRTSPKTDDPRRKRWGIPRLKPVSPAKAS